MSGQAETRFDALDGWRGLCALLVAVFHLKVYGSFYDIAFIRNGWLFVDFFFVLSGFVIAHAYQSRLSTPLSVADFMIRRFGRVWPLHAAILLALIAAQLASLMAVQAWGVSMNTRPFTGLYSAQAIPANFLLLQSLGLFERVTWNTPAWSISVEFYTYVVFAVVALVAGGRGRASLFLFAAMAFAGAAMIWLFSPRYMGATYDFGFFRCLFGFFSGCLVYQVARRPWKQVWLMTGLEILVTGMVVIFVAVSGENPTSMLAVPLFAGLIWVFAHEGGVLSAVLKLRAMRALGRWSYSIYMIHPFIFLAVSHAGISVLRRIFHLQAQFIPKPPEGAEQGFDLVVLKSPLYSDMLALALLACVLVVSAATYRFVEDPARRYFNRMARGLSSSQAAIAPQKQAV